VLRRGARVGEHAVPWALTIQTLQGSGTLRIEGGRDEALVEGRVIFLAPGMQHAVHAHAKKPLVLLLHQLKQRHRRRFRGGW
jgi:quercetin dioxygenase-like cupin family protein